MEFYESFMKFSFADSDVFCIEADPLVVNSTGQKACECVVLLSPRVAFIEAKASAPKEVASSAFMDEIKRKFADSLKSATCNILDIWGCGYLSKTTRFRKESL